MDRLRPCRLVCLTLSLLGLTATALSAQGRLEARYLATGGPVYSVDGEWGGQLAVGYFPGDTYTWSLEFGLAHFPSIDPDNGRSLTTLTVSAAQSSAERRIGVGFRPTTALSIGLARLPPAPFSSSGVAWYLLVGVGVRMEVWLTTQLGLVVGWEGMLAIPTRYPSLGDQHLGVMWRW